MYDWDTADYRVAEDAERQRIRDAHPDIDRFGVCCRRGWLPLVAAFVVQAKTALPEGSRLTFLRAREKFGVLSLSYRAEPWTAAAYAALREIEDRTTIGSLRACEVCGEPGVLRRPGGWYMTRCTAHAYGAEQWRED